MKTRSSCHRDNIREIGATIADNRKRLKLSQAELSERTRIHVNTVSNLERGVGDPSVSVISLILTQLGCPGIGIDDIGLHPWKSISDADPTAIGGLLPPPLIVSVIGSALRALREERRLSLAALAEAARIHPNTIWNIESGLVDASAFSIHRLYLALGVSNIAAKGSSLDIR